MNIKSNWLAAVVGLLCTSAIAAPPNPELPTGACSAVFKRSPVTSYPARQDFPEITPGGTLYFDFDNLRWYVTILREKIENGDEFTRKVVLADADPFTMKISAETPYAIEVTAPFDIGEGPEDTSWLLMPVNGGQSFLLLNDDADGEPYFGVCQKV